MERLRRKFFKIRKSTKSIKSGKIASTFILKILHSLLTESSKKSDDEIYLEPEYDETSNIAIHFDAIAEELINIAKKSVNGSNYILKILTSRVFLVSYNSTIKNT